MEGPTHSTKVNIAVALIGLVASLGVAWITTGSTFDEKFDEVQEQYEKMRDTLDGYDAVQARADEQLRQLRDQMRDVEDSLDDVNRRLADVREATQDAEVRLSDVNEALVKKRSALAILERKTADLQIRRAMQPAAPSEELDAAVSPPDEG